MHKFYFILSSLFLLTACQATKKGNDIEVYSYLKICFEDYYLNYDVEVTPLLDKFELLLLEEGHLSDTSGKAYKALFDTFKKKDYFNPPLKMEDFNNTLLYKNPSNIINCATSIFSLDSVQVLNTNFSKIASEINEKISNEQEVSIHYFFDLYRHKLTDEEIRMPYIKQSIQLMLYRWYFKSKYDREIQLKADNMEE